jgi:Ni/Co efflux regulator RcnB
MLLMNTLIYVKHLKLKSMKKLLVIALMLAFTLPSFAQVPTQDTTRKTTDKTRKQSTKGKWKNQKDTTRTMRSDTSRTDTTKTY